MRWIFRGFFECFWWLFWGALLSVLLYLVMAKIMVAKVPEQVPRIEYALSERLQAEVKIESIEFQPNFLMPTVVIRNFTVYSSAQSETVAALSTPDLSVNFCQFGFDILRSIWRLQPVLSFFHMDGAQVQLVTEDHRWSHSTVRGLEGLMPALKAQSQVAGASDVLKKRYKGFNNSLRVLDRLVESKGIIIQDADIRWDLGGVGDQDTQHMTGHLKRATLSKWENRYQIEALLALETPTATEITLKSHIQGESLLPNTWEGDWYAQSDRLNIATLEIKQWIQQHELGQDWLAQLQAPASAASLPLLSSGFLQTELWGHFIKGEVDELTGSIVLEDIQTNFIETPKVDIDELTFQFKASRSQRHRQASAWEVGFFDVHLRSGALGDWWLPSFQTGFNEEWVYLQAQQWSLAEVSRLIQSEIWAALAPESFKRPKLADYQFQGQLNSLLVAVEKSPDELRQKRQKAVTIVGEVDGLGLKSLQGTNNPLALTGLSGRFKFEQQTLSVYLDSDKLMLFHPKLFRDVQTFNLVKGDVSVVFDPEMPFRIGKIISSPIDVQLAASNADDNEGVEDIKARVRLHKQSIASGKEPVTPALVSQLWVQLAIDTADIKTLRTHLPIGMMQPSLVNWIDEAIVGGRLSNAQLIFRMPWRESLKPVGQAVGDANKNKAPVERSLAMAFEVSNATVDYKAPWPFLTNGKASVNIINKHTDVKIERGQLLAAQVLPTDIYIGPGVALGQWSLPHRLKVQGRVKGDSADGLKMLRQSPLKQSLEPVLKVLALSGEMKVEMTMNLPLNTKRDLTPQQITVAVDLADNTLTAEQWLLNYEALTGRLVYDSKLGLSAHDWHAQFLEQPVMGDLLSQPLPTGEWSTQLHQRGKVTAASLSQWLQLDQIFHLMTGECSYAAYLNLGGGADNQLSNKNTLEVSTDLAGLSIKWPEPFTKLASQERQTVLKVNLATSSPVFDLAIGDLSTEAAISLNWQSDANGFKGGRLHFGKRPDAWFWREGKNQLRISGDLQAVDWEEWMKAFEGPVVAASLVTNTGLPRVQSKPNTPSLKLSDLDVHVDRLTWQALAMTDADIQMYTTDVARFVDVRSSELDMSMELPNAYWTQWFSSKSSGVAKVKDEDRPIQLQVEKLVYGWEPSEPVTGLQSDAVESERLVEIGHERWQAPLREYLQTQPLWLRQLPAIDARFNTITLNQNDWGSWQFGLRPVAASSEPTFGEKGLLFVDMMANVKGLTFNGKGKWLWDERRASSSFEGALSVPKPQGFFAAWELPKILKSKAAEFQLSAAWPDHVFAPSRAAVSGSLSGTVKEGRLLNTDADFSPIRLIGLLNIDTLARRLQLDFSDVLEKGLAFDRIDTQMRLNQDTVFVDRLFLKGPSTQLALEGTYDIDAQSLDQRLSVTVPVSRNLVLPAAATGGLPAAATAYLIEQVLGEQLDKLTTLKYQIRGDLKNPVLIKDSPDS